MRFWLCCVRGDFFFANYIYPGTDVLNATEYADSESLQTLSLYNPLESVEGMFQDFLYKVEGWATKPK